MVAFYELLLTRSGKRHDQYMDKKIVNTAARKILFLFVSSTVRAFERETGTDFVFRECHTSNAKCKNRYWWN
jgi:hypothetical protein